MNICRKHLFGEGEIEAFELGYAPVGRPLMNVFFYLVDGVLIDTAQSNMRAAFLKMMKDKKTDRVLLTHHHEDHSGNALAVKKMKDVPVYGHPYAAEKLRKGFNIRFYQSYTWGKADRVEVKPLPGVIETGKFSLVPIHTPGHSKDHTVFLEKERGWLFSGDLFLGPRIKYFRADEDMKNSIESLRKILQHDFDSLFCGMNPRPGDGKQMLKNKLVNLEELYGRVEDLVRRGYDDKSILKVFRHEEVMLVRVITMGNVSHANMVRSAIRGVRSSG